MTDLSNYWIIAISAIIVSKDYSSMAACAAEIL